MATAATAKADTDDIDIVATSAVQYKNSSKDEIANVNFLTISQTYFKIPKKREPTSFNKLDDS